MALEYSPNTVTTGLLSMYDAANVKSYGGINYVSYSNYNAATWSNIFPANATLTTGIVAPDGTATAVRITCTSGGNSLIRVSFPSFTPNGTSNYTASFYVRKVSGSVGTTVFDLADATPTADYTASLVTGQWVRIQASAVSTAVAKSFVDLLSDGARDYVLDFWGVQVEPGLTATQLTTTTGSVATTNVPLWRDLMTTTNNATYNSTPQYSNGALVFNGSFQYSITYNARYNFNAEQTIAFWYKPTASATRRNPYNQAYGGGGTITHEIAGGFSYYWGTAGTDTTPYTGFSSSFTVVPNEIAYVTLVRNTENVYWYKNGVFSNSTTNPYGAGVVTGTSNITIGYGYAGGVVGEISVMQIYNVALTASQVAQNFQALRGRYGV